jgi:primosomal protein N' (replication factor Y)
MRVTAPLGRQILTGVVVGVHENAPTAGAPFKNIVAILDDTPVLPPAVLEFTRALSAYQATSWGALLAAALPPEPGPPRKRRPVPAGASAFGQLELDLAATPAVIETAAEIGREIEAGRKAGFLGWGGDGARRALIVEAARAALARNRTVLILLPEVARVEELGALIEARLGTVPGLMHGRLTPRAQAEEYAKICRGEARIILGSRMALFKPWPPPGLIVVDDESDESHVQTESPAFDVRRGAALRAGEEKSVVLFLSGAPTVEAYANARAGGSLRVLGGEDPPPNVLLVDDAEARDPIVQPLRDGLAACLAEGGRSIVFLNRRGYASLLFCPRCGFIPRCGRCGTALSFHKREDRLVCHACGTSEKRPGVCPACRHKVLEPRGGGVESVEEELLRLFPKARIAVFDRDRAGTPAARAKIVQAYECGRVDILIGTQLLVRRADLPPADFIGILNPEAGLARPDLTASQRTFQTLIRMLRFAPSGRMRPGAVVQTGFPDHYSIRTAVRMDFQAFFTEEFELRRLLRQPPFVALAEVVLCGHDSRILGRKARALVTAWHASGPEVEVLGPSFVSDAGGPGLKRVQLSLRADSTAAITEILADGLKDAGSNFSVLRFDAFTG